MACTNVLLHCHLISPPIGVTIGLELPRYTVNEGAGSIEVCAALLRGNLQRTLMANLSTQQNANAKGKYSEKCAMEDFS